ncbi:MAG: S41 family peptidase [Armatimonadota bacterium]
MKTFRLLPLVALLIASNGFAQTIDKNPEARAEVLESLTTKIEQTAFIPGIDFKKFREFLAAEKPRIDEAKNDEEFRNSVNVALRKFGFSHILLATPKDMDQRTTGKTTGIGITSIFSDGGRLVTRVVEDSPASKAGLEVGDLIIEIDGKKIDEKTVMVGEAGTIVKLRVKKADGKTYDFTITRRLVSTVVKDTIKEIAPKTMLLTIHTFDRAYDRSAVDALMKQAIGSDNLVVDLRLNGGGAVLNLFHLAGYFLDSDVRMGTMLNRASLTKFRLEQKREPADLKELAPYSTIQLSADEQSIGFRGNVVILINGGTGSASEIFTASMREQYGKIVNENGNEEYDPKIGQLNVVGQKSAGAVLFSTYNPIAQGFYVQLPIADYLTSAGVRLEANPLSPDVMVEAPPFILPGKPDKALEAALAIFERIKIRKQRGG